MLQIWPYICRTWDKWHSVERCSHTLLFAQRLFSSLAWGTGKRESPDVKSFLAFLTLASKLLSVFSPSYLFPWACEQYKPQENVRYHEHSIYTTRFTPTTKSFSSEQSLRVFFLSS